MHTNHHTRGRRGLKTLLAGALATTLAMSMAACGGLKESSAASSDTIRIGYISPRTGAASAFAESDAYILKKVREAFEDGIETNGKTYKVEILDRDTGSDPAKAATIADQLITKDGVDMILVTSTPETIHPVSDKCELEGIPCISTIEPWQGWYYGRGGTETKDFDFTYHFFDGLEHIAKVESDMWGLTETNKKVGVLWPNDADGAAFRDKSNGYIAAGNISGYEIVDPGAYEDGTKDFSSVISKFKQENVEILAGVPSPPDFATFWTQAAQQGFRPKVATISKAILFESGVASLPNGLGDGLSAASFWVPQYPFTSSLDGMSATELADGYEASPEARGQTWNQALGPNYALFEVANAVLSRVDPKDRKAVADQIGKTSVDTILGKIDWTGSGPTHPVKNVATIPMVGTQWIRDGEDFTLDVVSNELVPEMKLDADLVPIQ
ncbi:MAG: ABC transporter substrate-binding protein [Nocardioides sp.]|uniref:ABC transporter substrate-binding protein n=1 Tax=Nocardioides sp. TaxID=35761 RepID=UPI003267F601